VVLIFRSGEHRLQACSFRQPAESKSPILITFLAAAP